MTWYTEEKVEKLILETVNKIAAGDLTRLFSKNLTLEQILSKDFFFLSAVTVW